jgi:hypothetical protein
LISITKLSAQTTVTKNLDVTVDIPKVVSVTLQDVLLGVLNPLTGITKDSTAVIRSNHYSWTLTAYAQRGMLTVFDGSAYDETTDTIPYTLAFNSADTNQAQKFISATPLPTSLATALSATFSRKTTGGKDGESFIFTINVPAATAAANWDAGDYRDVLYVTVTAN